jgi:hypothetical protein
MESTINVSPWIGVGIIAVERVMSLAREHSGEPAPPELFHRRENTQFVVNHNHNGKALGTLVPDVHFS